MDLCARRQLAAWLGIALLAWGCGGSGKDNDGGGDGGPSTFGVGGTVSGLAGVLVLQNNGGDDVMITDGTTEGTRRIKEVCPGPCSGSRAF